MPTTNFTRAQFLAENMIFGSWFDGARSGVDGICLYTGAGCSWRIGGTDATLDNLTAGGSAGIWCINVDNSTGTPTTLAAAVTSSSQTTIQVASSTGWNQWDFFRHAGGDICQIQSIAHPNWTISRGEFGTRGVTVANGAAITYIGSCPALSAGAITLFSGLSDTVHTVDLRISGGYSGSNNRIGSTSRLNVTGASPTLAARSNYGPQASISGYTWHGRVTGGPGVFTRNGVQPPIPTLAGESPGYQLENSAGGTTPVYSFNATTPSIGLPGVAPGYGPFMKLEVDGVTAFEGQWPSPTNPAENVGFLTGLDGSNPHRYDLWNCEGAYGANVLAPPKTSANTNLFGIRGIQLGSGGTFGPLPSPMERILFVGDSHTQSQCDDSMGSMSRMYTHMVASRLRLHPDITAKGGRAIIDALNPPTGLAAPACTPSTSGGTIAAGTYDVAIAYGLGTGNDTETLPSTRTPVTTTGSTSSIAVTLGTPPYGARSIHVYAGTTGGTLYRAQASLNVNTGSVTLTTIPVSGTQPASAWINTYTLQAGLHAARVSGGYRAIMIHLGTNDTSGTWAASPYNSSNNYMVGMYTALINQLLPYLKADGAMLCVIPMGSTGRYRDQPADNVFSLANNIWRAVTAIQATDSRVGFLDASAFDQTGVNVCILGGGHRSNYANMTFANAVVAAFDKLFR